MHAIVHQYRFPFVRSGRVPRTTSGQNVSCSWIRTAQFSCSGRSKRGNLESCGGKNVHARLGPFYLNWPEPVLLGRLVRADGKRPKTYIVTHSNIYY